jgi:hypothetical protein
LTDIFHLHIVANTTDLDEESLEVDRDFFCHAFGELTPALKLVRDIQLLLSEILRVEVTLCIPISMNVKGIDGCFLLRDNFQSTRHGQSFQ